jgi:GTP cyclohydrolase I
MKNTNTIYQNQEETLIDKSDSYRIGDEQKIKLIANHFKEIMNIIGLDLNDDSLNDTHRIGLLKCM